MERRLTSGSFFSYVVHAMKRRVTMFSFRVADEEAAEARRWAEALGIRRSELLREALHRHLVRLRSERDTETELSLGDIADWGPAEDWADWDVATR